MLLRWTVWLHKWLALVIGAQVVLWIVGGLVMVVLPIQKVRGEHHIAVAPAQALDRAKLLTLEQAIAKVELDQVSGAVLASTPRGPMWTIKTTYGREQPIDAYSGAYLEEISEAEARRFAEQAYAGPGKVVKATYYDQPPMRSGAYDPAFAIGFDDPERSVLYISAFTGAVLSRRSAVWSAYDLAWKFHIMNFKDGDNYNTPILFIASLLAAIVTFSGVVLLWIKIGRDLKVWRATSNARIS